VEESARAPDYCFRIGGLRKFFVETKKPSVNLKDDIAPAFQLRRYVWSAKLAQNIALHNPDLGTRELNEAVQSTIDRIVFLRIHDFANSSGGRMNATTPGSFISRMNRAGRTPTI